MTPTPEELGAAADLAELTAEELLRRAKAMETQASRLLAQVSNLNAAAVGLGVTEQPEVEEHSVNRWGEEIGINQVITYAKEHSPFTRREFQEALRLTAPQASKWLARAIHNKPHPILVHTMQGTRGRASLYEYNQKFAPNPTERPEHASAVENAAHVGVESLAGSRTIAYTGKPIGSSGKPGRDKQLSKRRRVRRASGEIIGGKS